MSAGSTRCSAGPSSAPGRPAPVPATSGWSSTLGRLEKTGWQYSIAVRMTKTVGAAVEQIDEDAGQRIDDPDDGEAQIAETTYGERRLIVRRTRRVGAQAEPWPDGATSRSWPTAPTSSPSSRQNTVTTPSWKQVIADPKNQALAHFPSGRFHANGAWTVLGALAHNLLR